MSPNQENDYTTGTFEDSVSSYAQPSIMHHQASVISPAKVIKPGGEK
jgi:hypothetical protein